MQFFRFILVGLCAACVVSCKNDLKVNAPYEEIPSAYAVLNPSDTMHTIRVNKSFLGEMDANVMAKVADSINYDPGEIEVTLQRFLNGVQTQVLQNSSSKIVKFDESIIKTQPGSFNTAQRVYVLHTNPATVGKFYTSGEYRLTIRNLRTGNVFTAKANSLPAIVPTYKPMAGPPFYPYPAATDPKEYIDYSIGSQVFEVKHPANDAVIYQLSIRMHYVDSLSYQEWHNQSVEILIGTRTIRELQKLGGLSFLSHTFTGNVIYGMVGSELSKHKYNLLGRRMFAIEYIIHNSTQEYQDYIEYVKPSLSINQSKPLYSNFDGKKALGIFTFRNTAHTVKNIANPYMTSLARNPATCSYKIYDSQLGQPGCK